MRGIFRLAKLLKKDGKFYWTVVTRCNDGPIKISIMHTQNGMENPQFRVLKKDFVPYSN